MSSNAVRYGAILGAVILGSSLFYVFRKSSMIHASLTDVKTSADAIALFPTSVSQIKSQTQSAIDEAKKKLDAFFAIPNDERTFANTVTAFDQALSFSNLTIMANLAQAVDLVNPDEKMRAAGRDAMVQISSFLIDVTSDKRIYDIFKAYTEGNAKKENLTPEQKYFLDELMKDLVREGLNLPEEKLNQVKAVKKELEQLKLDFEKNIAEDQRKIFVNRDALAGLSDSFINSLKKDAEGNYTVGTDTPTYVQVMENCTVASTRKNLWEEYGNRAYPVNKEILQKVIAKRYELAQLLGFKTYAALEQSSKMAASPERVNSFLGGIESKAKAKAAVEMKEFTKNLPESVTLAPDGKLYPWDVVFVKNYYKKTALALDENKIAEYFPMQHTIEGLFKIYQQFFNIEFKELPAKGLWVPDVKLIEVIDNVDGKTMGYLFLDLFPREGKYTHACQAGIIPATYLPDGKPNLAVALVVANFPKPTDEKPSLLKYRDVTTFFHEFGHALHTLFGRTAIVAQSGPGGVKHDFVEMPSQMLEEWMADAQILKMVSYHYKTGQPLPEEDIKAILKLRQHDSGFAVSRQLYLANFDLGCFNNGPEVDLQALRKKLFDRLITGIYYSADDHSYASFGHLMGYGARYYGYMWSLVFAHDLFGEIEKEGLLNPVVGRRYVDTIIGRGGDKDQNEMLKDFLGREPNQDAFMKNMGF